MVRRARTHRAETPGETEPAPVGPAVDTVLRQAQERHPGDGEHERKYPPRRGWHKHNTAGVRRFENRDTKPWQSEIEFNEKPSPELMDQLRPVLKEAGFSWDKHAGDHGAWKKKIHYSSQAEDRLVAERAFAEIANIISAHKGLAPEEEGIPI